MSGSESCCRKEVIVTRTATGRIRKKAVPKDFMEYGDEDDFDDPDSFDDVKDKPNEDLDNESSTENDREEKEERDDDESDSENDMMEVVIESYADGL